MQLGYIVGLMGSYWGPLSRYVCRKELSSCVKLESTSPEEGGRMEWLLQEIMGSEISSSVVLIGAPSPKSSSPL